MWEDGGRGEGLAIGSQTPGVNAGVEGAVKIQAQVKNADAMTRVHGGSEPPAEPMDDSSMGPTGKFPQ